MNTFKGFRRCLFIIAVCMMAEGTGADAPAPASNYICPYDKAICPFAVCYSSRNYVACNPLAMIDGQVKVKNLNNDEEEVVRPHRIKQLKHLSKQPALYAPVLLDCATPSANCRASDQHHFVSCTVMAQDRTDQTVVVACGPLIDIKTPFTVLFSTVPVANIRRAIPKPSPIPILPSTATVQNK